MSVRRIGSAVIVLAVAACFSGSAFSQQSSRIARVTLYPGSAAIERAGAVSAGSGTLEMTGLPANFDLRTLRVEASPGIRVGEVSVQDVGRAEALDRKSTRLNSSHVALS